MLGVNDRICTVEGHSGTVRFTGQVLAWGPEIMALGIEWDNPSFGKHSGTLDGVKYFETKVPGSGSFLKSTSRRICRARATFSEALVNAYGQDYQHLAVSFGTKKVEDFGFQQLSSLQQNYASLRSISLDKQNICTCGSSEVLSQLGNVTTLDLSYNLFGDIDEIWRILRHMPLLDELNLNGNRFSVFSKTDLVFPKTRSLKLAGTRITVDDLKTYILPAFPNLEELVLASNGYTEWTDNILNNFERLNLVDLSFNSLTSIPNIVVKRLNLANNEILCILNASFHAVCSDLDLRYNKISDWSEIDVLLDIFPNLESLRINGNTLFDHVLVEEMTLNIVARLGLLKVNGSQIDSEEALNAELFFVSKVLSGEYSYNRNSTRWGGLVAKHRINESPPNVSVTTGNEITIGLSIRYTDGTIALERRFLRSHAILRVKGILAQKIGKNLLEMALFFYSDEDDAATRRELDDNFATVDYYGFSESQKIYVSIL